MLEAGNTAGLGGGGGEKATTDSISSTTKKNRVLGSMKSSGEVPTN